MTINEFKSKYYLAFSLVKEGNVYVSRTDLFERTSNNRIDSVETRNAVVDLNNWINDSQSIVSATPWTFDRFFNEVMRTQFDLYCRLIPIADFFPLDKNANPDLASFYL